MRLILSSLDILKIVPVVKGRTCKEFLFLVYFGQSMQVAINLNSSVDYQMFLMINEAIKFL